MTDLFGQVQHDGDREAVVLAGQCDQRLAGLGLDVGGVDDSQPPEGEALGGDEVQDLEGVVRDRLIVLVVADHSPAGVGGQDFGGQEVLAGERGLAGAAGADQDDEGQLGDTDLGHGVSWRWPFGSSESSNTPTVDLPGSAQKDREFSHSPVEQVPSLGTVLFQSPSLLPLRLLFQPGHGYGILSIT